SLKMSIPALRAWRVSSSHANRALVKKLTIQLCHLASRLYRSQRESQHSWPRSSSPDANVYYWGNHPKVRSADLQTWTRIARCVLIIYNVVRWIRGALNSRNGWHAWKN